MKLLVLAIGLFFGVFSVCNAVTPEEFLKIKDSAEQGDVDAQFNLGIAYSKGVGVPQDDSEAVKWFLKAAEQGDAIAQLNLGIAYAVGQGLPQDFVYSYKWVNLAAAKGDKNARSVKETIAENMTREQIAEAQKLSREWMEQQIDGQ